MRDQRDGAEGGLAEAAFSLIELMIVIGIMVVLGGLLVPAVEVLRERGKASECTNNLRQWGQGFSMYLDEHRGIFPGDGTESGSGDTADIGVADAWFNVVPPYINLDSYNALEAKGQVPCAGIGKSPFICPKSIIDQDLLSKYVGGSQTEFYCSYAMNYWVFNPDRQNPAFTKRMRLSQVRKPSVFVVLAESPDGKLPKVHAVTMKGEDEGATGYRHRNCANALFADWHVEPLLRTKVLTAGMTVQDNGGEVQWNPDRDESNAPLE